MVFDQLFFNLPVNKQINKIITIMKIEYHDNSKI